MSTAASLAGVLPRRGCILASSSWPLLPGDARVLCPAFVADPFTSRATAFATAVSTSYRVERELGAGGMATVYLAEDLKHHRNVAIKVLHPELSAILGPERFLKEIELTASLQHPHILPLFDSGSADGLLFYVMPFVEGETLRSRLEREQQLPVGDAVQIAAEVADALAYAHDRGVIHRDIKPENILLQDGHALVADFGIALAVQSAGGTRLTQTGLSLGTPAYMAPEQAMGEKRVDARADIYALGAVTYEMLAGEAPFAAPTAQAIVARVLTETPRPLSGLRPSVTPQVDAAVATALAKLPADRFPSARAFAEALRGSSTAWAPATAGTVPTMRGARWLPWLVAFVAVGVALWSWLRPRAQHVTPPSRLAVLAPGIGGSGGATLQRQLALTPDGGTIIYDVVATNGNNYLVRQSLDASAATSMPDVRSGLADPVISPDGRYLLGIVYGERQMYRYPLAGGSGEIIPVEAGLHANADWDEHGTLWFSPGGVGLARLGPRDSVVRPFGNRLDAWQLRQVLPGGRLALVVRSTRGNATGPAALVDLRRGTVTTILGTPVIEARYTAGELLYLVPAGVLYAVPLDLASRTLRGTAIPIATGVSVTGSGFAQFAVSATGTVAYIPEEPPSLVLVSRDGTTRQAIPATRTFHAPQFSPDGHRLSVDITGADGRDVWILSLDDGTLSRATFERDGHDATWSPDGRFINFMSVKSGVLGVYRKRPGDAAPAESLLASPKLAYTGIWPRTDDDVITTASDLHPGSGYDIAVVRHGGRGPIEPLVATRFTEQYPALSPDGRWVAFNSDQSGEPEVYVRALAGDGEMVQVSQSGGSEAVWGPDGRELFYRGGEGRPQLMVAEVRTTPRLEVTSRRALFDMAEMLGSNPHANYSISPDGKTFAMVRRSPATRIMVIQNLPELVRRLSANAGQSR